MTSLNQILIFRSAAQTLKERFPDGLELGSYEVDRFIKFFGEKYHNSAFLKTLDSAKAERLLRKVGVVLDGKVYVDYPSWINNVVLSPQTTRCVSVVIARYFPAGLNIESTEQLSAFWKAAIEVREKYPVEGDAFLSEFMQIKRNAGLSANADNVVLSRMIEKIVAPFKGVVYPVSIATLRLIEENVVQLFADGCKLVYYSVFFERNSKLLTEKKFVSAEHFQHWISKVNSRLIRKSLYFESAENDALEEEKIREEIERVLPMERGKTGEELIRALVERLYIPEEKIREAFELDPRLLQIQEEEEEKEEDIKEEEEKHDGTFILDYDTPISDFRFSTPVLCVYRNEKLIRDCNWRELYCALVAKLFLDYPEILKKAVNRPIGVRNKVDFADKASASSFFKKPWGIAEDLYVESLPNAWEFLQKIKRALNLCGVPFDDVSIRCRRSNENTTENYQGKFWESAERYGAYTSYLPVKNSSFMEAPQNRKEVVSASERLGVSNDERERFEILLEQNFSNGYKLDNIISWARLQKSYYDAFSEKITFSQDQVDRILAKIGQVRNNCVYPKFNQEQKGIVETIINDVVAAFDAGMSVVYASAVLEKYQKEVAEELQIYAPDALASTLLEYACGKFLLRDGRFVLPGRTPSLRADVLLVAKGFKTPEKFDVWKKKLQFVPDELLRNTINLLKEIIIHAAKDEFFYAPNLPISSEDIERLAFAMQRDIEARSFISAKELFGLLGENCPSFYWDTSVFTELAVRDSIKYRLQKRFAFNSSVISLPEKKFDISKVFVDFARNRERFSYEELKGMSDELVTRIYWESVLSEAVRISKDEFVRKDQVNFNVEEFDSILDNACNGEYLPISDFDYYGLLPDIGVGQKCNEFILESFLFTFSKKFRLIHASFTSDDVRGAFVRKSSKINSYVDLIYDVLINAENFYKTQAEALNFIIEKGYQKRKKFSSFEQIFRKAKLFKEQKNKIRD